MTRIDGTVGMRWIYFSKKTETGLNPLIVILLFLADYKKVLKKITLTKFLLKRI